MSDADTHAAREARRFFEWIAVGLTVVCSLVVGVSLDWGPAILVLAAIGDRRAHV